MLHFSSSKATFDPAVLDLASLPKGELKRVDELLTSLCSTPHDGELAKCCLTILQSLLSILAEAQGTFLLSTALLCEVEDMSFYARITN